MSECITFSGFCCIVHRGKTECGAIPWVDLFFFFIQNRITRKVTEIALKLDRRRKEHIQPVRNSLPLTDDRFSIVPVADFKSQ